MSAVRLDRLAGWRAARAAAIVASVAGLAEGVATLENQRKPANVANVVIVASGDAEGVGCASALPLPPLLMQAPRPASIPSSEAIRAAVATWPMDLRGAFEERAAIVEFCGGERREVAERAAYAEVWPGWR